MCVYTHSGILLSHIKNDNATCSNMDGTRDYHTKWNKSETNIYITYMWDLKNNADELIYKAEIDSQAEKKNWRLPKRVAGNG